MGTNILSKQRTIIKIGAADTIQNTDKFSQYNNNVMNGITLAASSSQVAAKNIIMEQIDN